MYLTTALFLQFAWQTSALRKKTFFEVVLLIVPGELPAKHVGLHSFLQFPQKIYQIKDFFIASLVVLFRVLFCCSNKTRVIWMLNWAEEIET